MTPGRCRHGSATKTSSTRCATPSCRRIGSRTFGAVRAAFEPSIHGSREDGDKMVPSNLLQRRAPEASCGLPAARACPALWRELTANDVIVDHSTDLVGENPVAICRLRIVKVPQVYGA